MQTVYVGNTLINDVMLGSQRMDDVIQYTNLFIEYLIVAGGGAGGASPGVGIPGSGGGGAGGLLSGSLLLAPTNTSYSVQVGATGAGRVDSSGANGSPSIFNSITADGGGGGGGRTASTTGENGASGGGGGGASGTGGTGTAGQGFNGGNSSGGNVCGGGGGAKTAGNTAGAGGSGSGSIWLDNLEYSIGGGGDGSIYGRGNQGAGYGNGGPGTYLNNVGVNGQNGVVKIRYAGTTKASGGTITFDSGYTYHTYTYSAGVTSSFTY